MSLKTPIYLGTEAFTQDRSESIAPNEALMSILVIETAFFQSRCTMVRTVLKSNFVTDCILDCQTITFSDRDIQAKTSKSPRQTTAPLLSPSSTLNQNMHVFFIAYLYALMQIYSIVALKPNLESLIKDCSIYNSTKLICNQQPLCSWNPIHQNCTFRATSCPQDINETLTEMMRCGATDLDSCPEICRPAEAEFLAVLLKRVGYFFYDEIEDNITRFNPVDSNHQTESDFYFCASHLSPKEFENFSRVDCGLSNSPGDDHEVDRALRTSWIFDEGRDVQLTVERWRQNCARVFTNPEYCNTNFFCAWDHSTGICHARPASCPTELLDLLRQRANCRNSENSTCPDVCQTLTVQYGSIFDRRAGYTHVPILFDERDPFRDEQFAQSMADDALCWTQLTSDQWNSIKSQQCTVTRMQRTAALAEQFSKNSTQS